MNKKTTWVIIMLMSIALIGLTGFQIYWINNAIELNEKRFKENVFKSLHHVVKSLEDREVIHLAGNEFFFVRPDTIKSQPTIQLRHDKQIIIRSDDSDLVEPKLRDWVVHDLAIADDSVNRTKVIRKKEAVSVVMERLVRDKKPIKDRVKQQGIDSMLSKSLHEQGIHINFQYAVLNSADDSIVLSNTKNNTPELRKSDLKASLFPNDIMDNMSYLVVNFPDQNTYLFKEVWLTLLTSIIFILTIIGCFSYAIHVIFKQKKLSEIKNDFINNMTHELKTPIATVSLACQALSEQEVKRNQEQSYRYVRVIEEENKRLSRQVEKVLQAAMLDKESFGLALEETNIIELIDEAISNCQLTLNNHNGEIIKLYNQKKSVITNIDREHMLNVFHNLLDNAIKYSGATPQIAIDVDHTTDEVTITVSDKGIGMSASDIKSVFDKFYRVSTGNRHDVKGFGLGLSYVKTIIEKHSGRVEVKSTPGKGSTFMIKLPT